MSYSVKEIFYTLQGEGMQAGRPAVFCRFAGCNLWSGRERDRGEAICQFCDTDFVGTDGTGGGQFPNATNLAEAVATAWSGKLTSIPRPLAVCTGGEPLLQVDDLLVTALHEVGFEIAIETNGTQPSPQGIDWLCVSPKAHTELVVRSGNELKLVYPQEGAEPERYEDLDFDYWILQPMDGPDRQRNTELTIQHCLEYPRWRLSLQMHKVVGLP